MRPSPAVLILLLALSVPAFASSGAAFDERITRMVGTPTPLGPALVASDRSSWAITLDEVAYVVILAEAPLNSPFYLTASCVPAIITAPASRQSIACGSAGTHTIQIDPAGGVAIDITVRFRGHIADRSGAPYAFGFERTSGGLACVVPGVCLP